ncbi:MAG: hypothetical protein ACKOEY_07310, partial [Phenylobacterium sp.]
QAKRAAGPRRPRTASPSAGGSPPSQWAGFQTVMAVMSGRRRAGWSLSKAGGVQQSGCFTFFPESLFCRGRTRHEDLSKDRRKGPETPPVGATPRGAVDGNFIRAFDAAAGETARLWTEMEARLLVEYGQTRGRAMACLIRGDKRAECMGSGPPRG